MKPIFKHRVHTTRPELKPVRRSPRLELLEHRLLFSTYTVTTLGDSAGSITPTGTGTFNATTLRAALNAANSRAGADTVNFKSGLAGTVSLNSALPDIVDPLALTGPGASKLTVRRGAGGDYSVFTISRATVVIKGVTIRDGTGESGNYGGGIYNAGTLTLTDSKVRENSAAEGGGIFNGGTLTLNNSAVSDNAGGTGGGIYNFEAGTATLTNSAVSGNSASGVGGGIYNTHALRITNCALSGNSADASGGGLLNSVGNTAIITNSIVSQNSAREVNGGGIYNDGTVNVSGTTFSENSAGDSGGAVKNNGGLTLTNCTVSGNSANTGGGIQSLGGLVAIRSTLSGNDAMESGGGVFNDGPATITNSTLSGNSASRGGGGIYNNGGTLALVNSTISANQDAEAGAGGIYVSGGDVALNNSIAVGNTYGFDIAGTVAASSSHNVVGRVTGSSGLENGKNGNKVGVTPAQVKLGPLANNGGPTLTMALLPGSIAINAGSNARAVGPDGQPLTTDQRGSGFLRIVGGTVDVGAFEVQAAKGSVSGLIFKDLNGNRVRDAGEGVLSNWLVWADLNRDGRLNSNEPRTVSNTSGKYVLANVPAGYQLLRLERRAGWQQTYPRGGGAHGPTVLAGKLITGWDFGVRPIVG
ncbi:MAG TPA: choice-of-anchor Q domain-containing protein [Gemmataceae bacterium]|nr:choice-of-anchor Q domain-containing protein [Gemmataceae bacterium]